MPIGFPPFMESGGWSTLRARTHSSPSLWNQPVTDADGLGFLLGGRPLVTGQDAGAASLCAFGKGCEF